MRRGRIERKKSQCLQIGGRVGGIREGGGAWGGLSICCLSPLQKIGGKQRPWCL